MPPDAIKDGGQPPPDPLEILERRADEAFPPESPAGDGAAPPGGEPAAALLDPATVALLLEMPFNYVAARKGDHWRLSPEEQSALVPLATRVANKYSPAILAKWADEIALGAVLLVIVSKRMKVDNEIEAKKAAEKPAGAAA